MTLRDLEPGKSARITAIGCHRLLVENHLGLAEVTAVRVRLTTPEGMLAVSGRNLRLTDVRRGALCVTGGIRLIELPAGREAFHD